MKIVCQTCKIEGYLQHIGKNYYRARHYVCFKHGKPMFKYHRQDPTYVLQLLEQKENVDQADRNSIDPNKLKSLPNENNSVRGCPSLVGLLVNYSLTFK